MVAFAVAGEVEEFVVHGGGGLAVEVGDVGGEALPLSLLVGGVEGGVGGVGAGDEA